MYFLDGVNRNIQLIDCAVKNASPKYRALIYPELIATLSNCEIKLICVDCNYHLDDGFYVDFSFYYHPFKIVVLNYETVNNKKLEPFWGKDFRLAYNLILIHELGHFLAFNHNDFSENGAWQHGLILAEYLKLFSYELAQLFRNYFIVQGGDSACLKG
jgi:hypothetical protein